MSCDVIGRALILTGLLLCGLGGLLLEVARRERRAAREDRERTRVDREAATRAAALARASAAIAIRLAGLDR